MFLNSAIKFAAAQPVVYIIGSAFKNLDGSLVAGAKIWNGSGGAGGPSDPTCLALTGTSNPGGTDCSAFPLGQVCYSFTRAGPGPAGGTDVYAVCVP